MIGCVIVTFLIPALSGLTNTYFEGWINDSAMAHLHLGLLAYWVVKTIRYQLKSSKMNCCWTEIRRTMNTHHIVTTGAQNNKDEVIIKKYSEPSEKVSKIYDALKYIHTPFTRKNL